MRGRGGREDPSAPARSSADGGGKDAPARQMLRLESVRRPSNGSLNKRHIKRRSCRANSSRESRPKAEGNARVRAKPGRRASRATRMRLLTRKSKSRARRAAAVGGGAGKPCQLAIWRVTGARGGRTSRRTRKTRSGTPHGCRDVVLTCARGCMPSEPRAGASQRADRAPARRTGEGSRQRNGGDEVQ